MAKPDRLLASARENRSYGSGVRGIQLFFSSPLVAIGGIELFFPDLQRQFDD